MNGFTIYARCVIGCILALPAVAFSAEQAVEGGANLEKKQTQQVQDEWTCPGMKLGPHHRGERHWARLQELPHTTVEGRIEDVNIHEMCFGEANGLHLKLKSGDETFFVHVGPTSYINSKSFPFAIGDDVSVEGAVSEVSGVKSIFAYSIQGGGKKLILRDVDGRPKWAPHRGSGVGRLSHH